MYRFSESIESDSKSYERSLKGFKEGYLSGPGRTHWKRARESVGEAKAALSTRQSHQDANETTEKTRSKKGLQTPHSSTGQEHSEPFFLWILSSHGQGGPCFAYLGFLRLRHPSL